MPRQMHPAELAKKLAAGEPVFLLDVREPWEHATAHLPNSTLIPLGGRMTHESSFIAQSDPTQLSRPTRFLFIPHSDEYRRVRRSGQIPPHQAARSALVLRCIAHSDE